MCISSLSTKSFVLLSVISKKTSTDPLHAPDSTLLRYMSLDVCRSFLSTQYPTIDGGNPACIIILAGLNYSRLRIDLAERMIVFVLLSA